MTVLRKMHTDEVALRKARMLIGGKWVDSASDKVLEVEDPAHRRRSRRFPEGVLRTSRAQCKPRPMPFPPGRARFPASAGAFSRGLPMRLRHGSRSWRARLRSRPVTRFALRHALRQRPQSTSCATSAAWGANSRAKRSPSASMF